MSAPSPWLLRFAHLLQPGSSVLDVACGSGRNLRWLADQGFAVTGIDRDEAAVEPLRTRAEIVVADIEQGAWPLAGRRFDAVLVCNYLWRPLWPTLTDTVAAGGFYLHETFADGQQSIGKPSRADFLLQPGELLRACEGLHTVAYENGFDSGAESAIEPPGGQPTASMATGGQRSRFVQRIVATRVVAAPGGPPLRLHLQNPVGGS